MTANQNSTDSSHLGVVIRGSRAEDRPALVRLAQLDGRRTLDGERVLVAELEGEVAAALPLDGGEAIADPFRPTAALLEMLSLRARQIRDGQRPRRGIRRRVAALLRSPEHRPAMAPATPVNAAPLVGRDRDSPTVRSRPGASLGAVRTAVLLFNRDLRVHDHPALRAASEADRIVPLFVFDPGILRSRFAAANRLAFLLDSLRDLEESLRKRGARLFVRRGDPVSEAIQVARAASASELHVSADYSAYARRRESRLERACAKERLAFRLHPGATVVPPGELVPAGGDHFRVFSPYWRRWSNAGLRAPLGAPRRLTAPSRPRAGRLPALDSLLDGAVPSQERATGGETEGRKRMRAFLRDGIEAYEARHDDLPGDCTSRLSAHLRFGCVSPLELLTEVRENRRGSPFARQLCWRDFHHQMLSAYPSLPRRDYRHRGDRWSRSRRALEAWRAGRTGIPIVDAGMRQLDREGYMHNRARLITASFLTKDLYVDWRQGAWHFWDLLSDGEIANNAGNWQWVAGTGNDTRPNRILNPLRQAQRFDPDGDYVRRYVEELEAVDGPAVHRPWNLPAKERRALSYPEPLVNHAEAAGAFRALRTGG